ncbi:MAG TPA: hypothetical protein VFE05_21645 [Longimicrobiaceae bacterium]|jgi:hypothetical protein|nr:hypothetical protein [Longimicrobiaceae bacterium]
MSDARIKWTCQKEPAWQWMSAKNGDGAATPQELSGTVELPQNDNYWAPCASLVLQNVTIGGVMLRYFLQGGKGVVQARAFAAPHGSDRGWVAEGNPGKTSLTHGNGGFNLVAEIV